MLPLYEGTSVSLLRMRPFWLAPLVPLEKELLQQDQFGILAQIFWSCENLRLENFANAIFSARPVDAVKCRVGNCRVNDANREKFDSKDAAFSVATLARKKNLKSGSTNQSASLRWNWLV